jgi:hypothetical protein
MLTAAGFVHGFPNSEAKHGVLWIVGEVGGSQPPFYLAAIAEYSNEPLSNHGAQRRLQQEGLNAKVKQPRNGSGCGLGVQSGQHQMSGKSGMNGGMCRFAVAHLADHDHVGILSDEGA